ncbi:MAG TPA: hypothetical protein DD414_07995 [Lachnospiraceae bacterium]|nr:hypothetical protein [Lachnospiraceae bacterium]
MEKCKSTCITRREYHMDLAIFGAQAIALGAYEAIHSLYPERKIRCFLVTERGNNAEYCAGIPVLELAAFSGGLSASEKKHLEILIATPEDVMPVIEDSLDACGLTCHVRLTSLRWAELMGYYCVQNRSCMPLSALPVGYHRADIHMFQARFHKDRPLASVCDLPEWVVPIQVGAALCEERVADMADCDGENISGKNVNYSELTALYWVWKNRLSVPSFSGEEAYYGLCHYRRILNLTDDDLLRLPDNEVDVVLPYPMPYEPDIEAHHHRYLKKEDWDAVLRAVLELQPEYANVFPGILKQRFLYNYNILLAGKEVLAEYCAWLFPILERVEQYSVPQGKDRKDRYIGYVGETLETLYFMYNKDRLQITHAGCRFLT